MTNATSFFEMTARDIHEGIAQGSFSAVEVAEASLARIEAMDSQVHAYLELTPEMARSAAARIDDAVASGRFEEMGPLAGVPVAFKDNMNLAGTRTTCGSSVLEAYRPSSTADCVQRMLDAGCIPLGKLNMDEFAFGSSTETSAFGLTRNPWDLSRVPGGSSGGSAASVAAGLATISLGSDAGGSIRQPGAFCGTVAVKPSYGTISSDGIMAFATSLDQAGPFARCVEDAAWALNVLSGGRVEGAGGSAGCAVNFAAALEQGVKGMRIGIVPSFIEAAGLTDEVRRAVLAALKELGDMGAHVVEVELPHVDLAMNAYYVLGPCRAFANLAGFDPRRLEGCEEAASGAASGALDGAGLDAFGAAGLDAGYRVAGLGLEARRRVLLGAYLLSCGKSEDYLRAANRARSLVKEDYERAFGKVDAIVAPVTPRTAFKFGEVTDPGEMHLSDMFTVSVNIAGNGAMSLPVGLGSQTGLPVGVQVISPALKDANMFRVAAALEGVYGKAPVAPAFR